MTSNNPTDIIHMIDMKRQSNQNTNTHSNKSARNIVWLKKFNKKNQHIL